MFDFIIWGKDFPWRENVWTRSTRWTQKPWREGIEAGGAGLFDASVFLLFPKEEEVPDHEDEEEYQYIAYLLEVDAGRF